MKTLIAIPTSREIDIECAASVIGMKRKGRIGVFCPQTYSIDKSRNLIVEHALKIGYDYILWVDSDMILPKDAFMKMLKHDKDIVSGVYSYKLLNNKYAVAKRYKSKEDDEYEDIPLSEIRATKDLIEVDGIGFGCVLTKVEIFKNIKEPHFVYNVNMGEDIHFCRMAQKAGYKVYLDPTIRCDHIGKIRYNI